MKKIALFLGEYGTYQLEVMQTVTKLASKKNMKVHIFNNAGSYGNNIFHALGEKSIIRIPQLSDYVGIIICADTFGIQGMYEELAERINEQATCPIVCLRNGDEQFYNVLINNKSAMERMTNHFIEEHGYKRICFMSGRRDLADSRDRMQGYLDAMRKHGLEVTPSMLFEGNYWRDKGDEAVEWFFDGEEPPRAIVCANDYMAISICDALQKKGYRIPEDVAVSGFDDVEEVWYSVPTISSMYVSNEEIAEVALQIIENVNNGIEQSKNVYLEAKESYKQSCGCNYECDMTLQRSLFLETEDIKRVMYRNIYLNMDFENADTFEELMESARRYIDAFSYEAIYVCLCDEEEKKVEQMAMMENYTQNMVLRAVLTPSKEEILHQKFKRESLLPEEYLDGNKPLYISALHEKNNCLGYIVLKTQDIGAVRFFFQTWVLGMGSALSRLKMYEENKELVIARRLSEKDELTGIGNRREMEKILQSRFTRMRLTGTGFYVVSIDMDDLKKINDGYGHLEGDEALCALAEILDENKGEHGNVARVGGDEYMMCIGTEDKTEVEEVIANIRESIEGINAKWDKPYVLSASIGYAYCKKNMALMDCMRMADQNMYKEKRKKKESV
ncbi:MAG: GGDEF domain-containing protein [Lachnospiraceae bacterium]|nr:GGDEF domain-containing protein [Lachnospiraceae bacterium]